MHVCVRMRNKPFGTLPNGFSIYYAEKGGTAVSHVAILMKIVHLICAVLVPLLLIPLSVDVYCHAYSRLFSEQTPAPPVADGEK